MSHHVPNPILQIREKKREREKERERERERKRASETARARARECAKAGPPDPGRSPHHHSQANIAHIRQSRPEPGLGFQVKPPETLEVVSFSVGSGRVEVGYLPHRPSSAHE